MNLAQTLKGEIARVARKEIRIELASVKKASAGYRADIASLKRRVAELEAIIKAAVKRSREPVRESAHEKAVQPFRFSAKNLAGQRKRLGLSAADFGTLVGVSGQSIYHWEQGKSRPRASQLASIHAVRQMGKREAAAKLAELS